MPVKTPDKRYVGIHQYNPGVLKGTLELKTRDPSTDADNIKRHGKQYLEYTTPISTDVEKEIIPYFIEEYGRVGIPGMIEIDLVDISRRRQQRGLLRTSQN